MENIVSFKKRLETETIIIAEDVLSNFGKRVKTPPVTEACNTMRRLVDEMYENHKLTIQVLLKRYTDNPPYESCPYACYVAFRNVCNAVISDGQINWGRIVSIYTLGCLLSDKCTTTTAFEPRTFAVLLGGHISNKLGSWIVDQGGWNTFVDRNRRMELQTEYLMNFVCVVLRVAAGVCLLSRGI